jgi:hypothetical protein
MKLPAWIALTLSLTTAACAADSEEDSFGSTHQATAITPYEQIRGLEDVFPIPEETAVIDVGTFNGTTGEFTGLVTTTEIRIGPNGKPYVKTTVPSRDVGAIRTILRFHGPAGATVNAGGTIAQIPSGQTQVDVDVGRKAPVNWSIQSGSKSYSDKLNITRRALLAAGAFRVEAVPVAVVYAPSQPPAGIARAVFGQQQSNRTSLRLTNEHSSLDRTEDYVGADQFLQDLGNLAGLLELAQIPGAGAVQNVTGSLDGLMPSMTVVESVQIKDGTDVSAEVTINYGQQFEPSLTTGPGAADLVVMLRDVELAYVMLEGQVKWTILGAQGVEHYDVTTLSADLDLLEAGVDPSLTTSGLSRITVESLLALDPFVGIGSTAFLDPGRFTAQLNIGGINGNGSMSMSTTTSNSTTTSETTTSTRTVDVDPGSIVRLLGLGDESHESTSLSIGRAAGTSTTTTTSSSIAYTGVTQLHKYQVFFDRVFGTFAARTAMPVPDPTWSSEFRDAQGFHTSPSYWGTIRFPDVDGDGKADVCGRGTAGIMCQRSNDLSFGSISNWQASYSDANGWSNAIHAATIRFPDVNGDGKADVCGRGGSGIACAVSNGTAFGTATFWGSAFSNATEFDNGPQYYETIAYPDLNGDGKDDVCGRGAGGVQCALSTGAGFGTATVWAASFSDQNAWGSTPAYWSTLRFADINGDGKDDLCGRGGAGVYCQTSTGTGFATITLWSSQLSNANGWLTDASRYATIQLGDLDGDGKADLCARDITGLRCGRSTGTAFVGADVVSIIGFNNAAGFAAESHYRAIVLVDIDQDGKADACGRDATGVVCAKSTSVAGAAPSFGTLTRVVDGFTDADLGSSASTWATLRPANVQAAAGMEWCARTTGGIRCSDRP